VGVTAADGQLLHLYLFCMRSGEFHAGDDLAAGYGTPIYSVGAGIVAASGPAQGFGNWA
jgi:murein DD-endopeptidase MepM/ murein hydrolase activator NlpD